MSEQIIIPFDDEDGNQKYYSGSLYNYNVLGLPNGYSGLTKRNQLAWNKRGVALAYMIIPTLKSAVDIIATNLASVPMFLKDSNGDIIHRSDTSGSAQNEFLRAIESSYQYYGLPLMQLWATSILLYGENLTEKVPHTDFESQIVGLKWLNPLAFQIDVEIMESKTLRGKPYRYEQLKFMYNGKFGNVTYDEDEVLYSRGFNPVDDVRGYSDALSALSKANIVMEFENFTLAFYANNGHPGLIISPKDRLAGDKQVAEWQRSWDEKFRGSNNQFKTHISGFPFDVNTFDVLDISKPLEVSKDAESRILRAFRVPPEMIGDTADNSYQFSKESKNAFMQTVVRPLALSISNCINHSGIIKEFVGIDDNLKFGFDFSEYENVAKADLDKQDVLERRVKSGGISVGQYQRSLGQKPVDGSDDTYLLPQGFLLVKKDVFTNPDNLPQQPKDSTGFDSNSMNQQDRRTQSVTEEQDSVDFFGSKQIDNLDTEWEYLKMTQKGGIPEKYNHIDMNPPKGVREAAKRALEWISGGKAGQGFTDVGRARAGDLASEDYQPSPEVIRRMYSYFQRHQPDKTAEGFNQGEKDYPSGGRVAWDAWGGDSGASWSEKVVNQMDKADNKETKKSITALELVEIAKTNDITIEQALEILQEFE